MPRFDPRAFNRLLAPTGDGLGQRVAWRSALHCPCRNPHSGAPVPGCPICEGRGVSWRDPKPAWTGLAGLKVAREWMASTEYQSGDVVLTIPSNSPLYAVAEGDRITLVQSTEPFHENLTRGQRDRLGPAHRSATITSVRWLANPSTLVEGPLPAISANGTLSWDEGHGPPAGVGYVVEGRAHPEHFLFKDLPQDRAHHGGLALPRKTVARKFDLFGR